MSYDKTSKFCFYQDLAKFCEIYFNSGYFKKNRFTKKISTNDNRKKVRLRANIVLSRSEGLTYRMITKKLQCCKDTIELCLDMWNESGIGSIITWKRKIKIGKNFKRRNALERTLTIEVKSLKLPFTNWSLRTIKAIFSDWFNVKMSLSSVRRDLKILNFRLGKIEDKLIDA